MATGEYPQSRYRTEIPNLLRDSSKRCLMRFRCPSSLQQPTMPRQMGRARGQTRLPRSSVDNTLCYEKASHGNRRNGWKNATRLEQRKRFESLRTRERRAIKQPAKALSLHSRPFPVSLTSLLTLLPLISFLSPSPSSLLYYFYRISYAHSYRRDV